MHTSRYIAGLLAAGLLAMPGIAFAVQPLIVPQGGTGVGSISGILFGNGQNAFSTLTVGTGLSLTGSTLSATGGTTFGQGWEINGAGYLAPTTTKTALLSGGFVSQGSSTVAGTLSVSGLNLGSLTGFLKAAAGAVGTSLINLASDVTGTLPVSNGGTGSTTLSGLLKGNGTGSVQTAVGDTDYQKPLSLTTTGSSGAATLVGDVLNIPQYAGATYTATYPVTLTGSAFGLAFGTSSSNTWGGTQTFSSAPVLGSLTGFLKASSGTLSTALINLASDITGTLGVANGGTGSTTLTGILMGNGTGSLQTLTVGSGLTLSGTTLSTSGSGITALGPAGQLQTGGTQTLATSSDTNLGLTITASGNTQTFTSTWTGTLAAGRLNSNVVQAVTNDTNVTGGISAQTLTLGWTGNLAVSRGGTGKTSLTSSQLLYGNGTAALSSVATSSLSVGSGLIASSGTLGAQVGGSNVTLKQVENRGFSYATSTAWTGTTTIPLGIAYGEAWQTAKCFTDAGTLDVDFYHASTHFQFFQASTTVGTVNMGNTTDTSGDKVYVDIGTPASSPTKITCTVNDQI